MTIKKFNATGWTLDFIDPLSGETFVITGANAGAGIKPPEFYWLKAQKW